MQQKFTLRELHLKVSQQKVTYIVVKLSVKLHKIVDRFLYTIHYSFAMEYHWVLRFMQSF